MILETLAPPSLPRLSFAFVPYTTVPFIRARRGGQYQKGVSPRLWCHVMAARWFGRASLYGDKAVSGCVRGSCILIRTHEVLQRGGNSNSILSSNFPVF